MGNSSVADARASLDNQFRHVEELAGAMKYQEAAEQLVVAEELFEQLQPLLDPTNAVHVTILHNRTSRMDSLSRQVEQGLRRRQAGKKEDGNIAFKCNWNDKGYKGVCSDDAYFHNIGLGRSWCSCSGCRKHANVDPVPEDCCYEARAMLDCTFAAGWDHDAYGRFIRPRKIWSAREGKIAFLTTEPPSTHHRLVVGAFRITKLVEDPGRETWLHGDKSTLVDDMLDYEIRFWKYHKNPNSPNSIAWSTGLFRYVANVAALGILEEYISKKSRDGGDTMTAEALAAALKEEASKPSRTHEW